MANWIDYIKKEDADFIQVGSLERRKIFVHPRGSITDEIIYNIRMAKMDKEEKEYLASEEYIQLYIKCLANHGCECCAEAHISKCRCNML